MLGHEIQRILLCYLLDCTVLQKRNRRYLNVKANEVKPMSKYMKNIRHVFHDLAVTGQISIFLVRSPIG